MPDNALYYGDNLEILKKHIKDESVDLIYLDPPFNSKANYNILYKEPTGESSRAQITAFEDTWHWTEEANKTFQEIIDAAPPNVVEMMLAFKKFIGLNDVMAYLTMMCIRLIELRRVLKPSGSIYLHCDPTASHYLKILMDTIFGKSNFRNEIVWDYTFRMMDLPNFFNRKHDIILFYAKAKDNYFKMPKTEWTREEVIETRKQKVHIDEDGDECIWMPGGKGHSKNKLKKIKDIIKEGKAISDVWQMSIISSSAKERLGYPTQKPEALLETIINASSRPGDVVLDPFCGCGTTIAVAEHLKRNWIGIDITHLAINLIKLRMSDMFSLKAKKDYKVIGEPEDLDGARELALNNRHQFEHWAVSLIENARPYQDKKGSDTGIDGVLYFEGDKKTIIQVKSGHVGVSQVRDLGHVIDREKAKIGIFITLEDPTKQMKKEALQKGFYKSEFMKKDYLKIQIITIEELFAGKKPDIPLQMNIFKKAKGVNQAETHNIDL